MSQYNEAVVVEDGDLKAVLLPRTIRRQMQRQSLLNKVGTFYREMAEAEGVTDSAMDEELSRLITISVHLDGEKSTVDFDALNATDDLLDLRRKCNDWLDYENIAFSNHLVKAVNQLYAPANPPKKKANADESET